MFSTAPKHIKHSTRQKIDEIITSSFISQEIVKNKKKILTEVELLKNNTLKKLRDEMFRIIMIRINEFIIDQIKIEVDKLYLKNSELNIKLCKAMLSNDENIISMINRLRAEIFENAGLCVIT